MSDWHFGIDYDMWLYPPVDWTAPDYDYELPEPIEAANIEGTLLVNAEDAIEQVRCLQAENAKLRDEFRKMDEWHSKELIAALVKDMWPFAKAGWAHTCPNRECCLFEECDAHSERECPIEEHMAARMRDLGIEVPNGN